MTKKAVPSTTPPFTSNEVDNLEALGYTTELQRNRSLFTLLFQSLAIAAIPYGEGGPFINAIYGGVSSRSFELASRYPTSAGPYYWSFQVAKRHKTILSFITGWIWLIGNWTITLSVNFGFASLISATIAIYHPNFEASDWQLTLIFYAICLLTFVICTFGNRFLPMIDTICACMDGPIPYIFHMVMGSPGGGLGLTFLVLAITMFCSISITVAASRCTWAFARDQAIPGSRIFSMINKSLNVPVNALILVTMVQMLLGLINFGSSSAFTAFVSVGVMALFYVLRHTNWSFTAME
ncbi:hypothetical protein DID88_009637 [Monilinia fructigena]|uniref:Uncharacterized protein n=1 Tax=Monilinia fructigena TaxID=38457 RepID=A0A395ITC3_9HELO|nr:hypothetical protein DID88_009637 [Monilinia fructigena]